MALAMKNWPSIVEKNKNVLPALYLQYDKSTFT